MGPSNRAKLWLSYLNVELVDSAGAPMAGELFEVILPNGKIWAGRLDEHGRARIDGIEPGGGNVRFPALEDRSWGKYP